MAKVKTWINRFPSSSGDLGALDFEYTPEGQVAHSYYDNQGVKKDVHLSNPVQHVTVKGGPDLYDFLYNILPKAFNKTEGVYKTGEVPAPEVTVPTEKFKFEKALPMYTEERRNKVAGPGWKRVWDVTPEDIEFEVDPAAGVGDKQQRAILQNILNESRDFTPILGSKDDVPSNFMPVVRYPDDWKDKSLAGQIKYGRAEVAKARAAGVPYVTDGDKKTFFSIPMYENVETPMLNFNDPVWQRDTLDKIREDYANGRYKLHFGTDSLEDMEDLGVALAYADPATGKIKINPNTEEPERFDYMRNAYHLNDLAFNRRKKGLTGSEKEEEIDTYIDRLTESFIENPEQAIVTATQAGDDATASAIKKWASDVKNNSNYSQFPDEVYKDIYNVAKNSKEVQQFANSLFGVTRDDLGDLRAFGNDKHFFRRLVNPATGLPVGDIFHRPVRQYTEKWRRQNRERDAAANAAQTIDYTTMDEGTRSKLSAGVLDTLAKNRGISDTTNARVYEKTKGVNKGQVDVKTPAKVRIDGREWIKALAKGKGDPAAVKVFQDSGLDPEALRTYFIGAGGDGQVSLYQKYGLDKLAPVERAKKMVQIYNDQHTKDARQARIAAILAGMGAR